MSYEQIILDDNGAELCITAQPEIEAPILLRSATSTAAVTFKVPAQDAPAVALAILEAAGIEPDDKELGGPAHTNEQRAVLWLREVQKERAKRAEREAEDAKVDDFRNAICADDWTSWAEVPEDVKDTLRIQYHAARKFFAESPE